MYRLLYAGLSRLVKNRLLWLFIAGMFALGLMLSVITKPDGNIEMLYFIFSLPTGVLVGTVACMFIGTDYSDGTIRNKLVVGHSRAAVYLSNFMLAIIGGFVVAAAYLLPILTIGIARLGGFVTPVKQVLIITGIALLMTVALGSLATLVIMLTQSKAVAVVSFLVGLMALLTYSLWLHSALNQPEYIDNIILTYDEADDGSSMSTEYQENIPNPNYVSGTKREVYQFLLEFMPTGQMILITGQALVNLWQPAVYSLIIILVSTIAGVLVFRRQNIK